MHRVECEGETWDGINVCGCDCRCHERCNLMMPQAKEPCFRRPLHKGPCATWDKLANDRDRKKARSSGNLTLPVARSLS